MASTASPNTHSSMRQGPPKMDGSRFPMSYSTSFSQWWASGRESAVEAQKAVLSFLPFFPRSDEKRTATVNLVKLSGKNRVINELEIRRGDEPVERTLVMLHGYGAGLGLFYRYSTFYTKCTNEQELRWTEQCSRHKIVCSRFAWDGQFKSPSFPYQVQRSRRKNRRSRSLLHRRP